jgi:uncharacterized protein (TIGR03663 family)
MKALRKHKLLVIIVIILALAVLSRFAFLGIRPMHHDEGMLSYFGWQLASQKNYSYTPQIHGPILFYVQALLFLIFKVGDWQARLGEALFGVILVLLPFIFIKTIGKKRAIAISTLLLVSPVFLYFSRFIVHTSLVVVFWFIFVFAFKEFVRKPRTSALYTSAVTLALAFGTSETTYIFVAAFVLSLMIATIFLGQSARRYWTQISKFIKEDYLDVISAVLIFLLVWAAIYSVGFSNSRSLTMSLPNPWDKESSLGFWLAQHKTRLGGQPWYYYFMLATIYEFIALIGSILAIIDSIRKKQPFYLFLAILTIIVFAGFSIAGEKFPWLFLPSLLPMTILTGYYLGENWNKFWIVSKLFWIVLIIVSAFVAFRLSYINHTDPVELAVYVQTPQVFQNKINEIDKACATSPDKNCVFIDQKISWPMSWSFRNTGTLVYTSSYQVQPSTKYIIISNESTDAQKPAGNWSEEKVKLRDWWVPTPCRQLSCVGNYVNYFVFRKIWNEKGGYDVTLYSKQ